MANINFTDLPIGQSFVGTENEEIKITYERTGPDTVKLMCYDFSSESNVMTAFIQISTGRTKVENADSDFWDVTLDGKPIEEPIFQEFDNLSASVTANKGDYRIELESS